LKVGSVCTLFRESVSFSIGHKNYPIELKLAAFPFRVLRDQKKIREKINQKVKFSQKNNDRKLTIASVEAYSCGSIAEILAVIWLK
jgi:hypothetical protein